MTKNLSFRINEKFIKAVEEHWREEGERFVPVFKLMADNKPVPCHYAVRLIREGIPFASRELYEHIVKL